jgi:hypothetical protein
MWIQEAVEWTLLREGSLNRRDLVSQVYAFPFLSSTPSGIQEIEARVSDVTRHEASKYRYCIDSNSWSLHDSTSAPDSVMTNQIPKRAPEVHGCGKESVYLIYSPVERYKSVRNNSTQKYRIKIGKTKRSTVLRLSELQTGNPDELRVGLEFRTNKSTELESFLHKELRTARITESSNSKEWFNSSFEEVIELYKRFKSEELH